MAGGWHVSGQRGTSDLVSGRLVDVMEVTVTTDDGTSKSFMIPLAQYTPAGVRAIVDDWYERQQGVAGLNL